MARNLVLHDDRRLQRLPRFKRSIVTGCACVGLILVQALADRTTAQSPSGAESQTHTHTQTLGDEAPFTECDTYGAAKDDPQKKAAGTAFETLDAARAIPACEDAIERFPNSARLNFQLGRAYDKAGNIDAALRLYQKAAEQEYAAAQLNYGVMYDIGKGVPKDSKEAVKWYRLAANQGLAAAQASLAGKYLNGDGVQQDEVQAAALLRKAANHGLAIAQYRLGLLYENGWGVEKDTKEAVTWITKAAGQGYDPAKTKIAELRGSQSQNINPAPSGVVEAKTLPVRIGAFDKAFNEVAKNGAPDLLAEAARCGRGACYYQITWLDSSIVSKVTVASGSPENHASSIELQAPFNVAQNTLGNAVMTIVQMVAPQLSATDRLHVMRSLLADIALPESLGPGGAGCVNLVPGHWIISGNVFDRVIYIRIQWPSSSPRGQAGKCRHLVSHDDVLTAAQFVPHRAQQAINDCRRESACWLRKYPEAPGWCVHGLINRGELQALPVGVGNSVDTTPREIKWAENWAWPTFSFVARHPKLTKLDALPRLIVVEYACTYDPLTRQVVDVRVLANENPATVPFPPLEYYLPRGAR